MSDLSEKLEAEHGWWGEHPKYAVFDWQFAVANGDTRLGYWGWVARQLEGNP